jgi:prevent-host-death family protein
MEWQVAEAKNKLSELLSRAETEGPQLVTRRNKRFVVIEEEEYRRTRRPEPDLIDLLLNGPKVENLELPERKVDMREVNFE